MAIEAIRNSAVIAYSELRPDLAAPLWSGHPKVEISRAMVEIADAARARKPVDPAAFALVDDAARKAPLSPEPFLVHGVRQSVAGNRQARQDFIEAQRRDPRSMPAAYFLANDYFRTGQALPGLKQAALLARLFPDGTGTIAPYVARYAQDRSTWPEIRALFRSNEDIEDAILNELALDGRNASVILAIAGPAHRLPTSPWLPRLLQSLVQTGDYSRARAIWLSVARVREDPGALLYDGSFSDSERPPPFNWSLTSSTLGIAERQAGGKLHVIYYGQDDGVLASQLLLLGPGAYRLQMALGTGSTHSTMLSWSIRCDKSDKPLSSMPADRAAVNGWSFEVPSNCGAQWLELSGIAGDFAQQAEITIAGLSLREMNRNAR